MIEFIRLCTSFLAGVLKSRAGLQAENLALRHRLCVYQRSVKRTKVKPADCILWSLLAKAWMRWKDALIFAKPDTHSLAAQALQRALEEVVSVRRAPPTAHPRRRQTTDPNRVVNESDVGAEKTPGHLLTIAAAQSSGSRSSVYVLPSFSTSGAG